MAANGPRAMMGSLQGLGEHSTAVQPVSVRLAWRSYLEETRSATYEDYEWVEGLAWQRLADELNKIGRPLRVRAEQL
jgi:hypothetical protein